MATVRSGRFSQWLRLWFRPCLRATSALGAWACRFPLGPRRWFWGGGWAIALVLFCLPSLLPAPALALGPTWRGASFPVENFQAYTSAFGYRRSATGGPNREFHYGLDLAAPEGSYIRSWWAGQIVELTDNTNCGTSVVVASGSWEHIYCHLKGRVEVLGGQRYLVDRDGGIQLREGQGVNTGMRIGRVGMTGRTTGPHLHWGLKHRGKWVDPGRVLRAMRSAAPLS